jgi:hypothetical protein
VFLLSPVHCGDCLFFAEDSEGENKGVPCVALFAFCCLFVRCGEFCLTQRGRSKVFLVMLLCFLLSVCFCCGKVLFFFFFFLVVVFSGIHCQEGGLRVGIRLRTEKFCFSLVLLLLRQSPNVGFGFVDLFL